MVKVLHINAGNLYGGVETFLSTLAESRNLCPEMRPEFALCFAGRQSEELRASGCPVHMLNAVRMSRPWTILKSRRALGRLAESGRYDIIVGHQPWIQALLGKTAANYAAYAAYFHGPADENWLLKAAVRTRPSLVIAPSEDTMRGLSKRFPDAIREVVNYPLPNRLVHSKKLAPGERSALRSSLGATENDAVVFQASRIEAWKGPDLTIRALAGLRDVGGWQFWLAGSPQRPSEERLYGELRSIAREGGIEDRVHFLGQRQDVSYLMQCADIYCQGNRGAEGFSLSFLEASYSGLPIVTTALGGAMEMIDSETGILVPPGDAEALTEGLRGLITGNEKRLELGRAARLKAIRLSDAGQQIRRLGGIFTAAAERDKARRNG